MTCSVSEATGGDPAYVTWNFGANVTPYLVITYTPAATGSPQRTLMGVGK